MYITYSKLGKKIKLNLNTPDEYKISRKIYQPLPADRIVGIDTESPTYKDEPFLKYLQLYSPQVERCYDLAEMNKEGLDVLFSFLLEQYGEEYERESRIKQRTKVDKTKSERKSNTSRDGRRIKVTPVVLAFFNLEYDLGRLIDKVPVFRRVIAYGADSYSFDYNDYTIEIAYSCLGVACPSFQWYIYHKESKRVVRVIGFDSSNYFRNKLKNVAAALRTPTQKMDIDADIFERDWFDKPPTDEEIEHFIEYSITDAKVHHEVYLAIVELLRDIDISIVDKKGCIPTSAPSAAMKVMQHMCSQDSYFPPPLWCQQLGFDAYKGAISFCVHPGYHIKISVVDISSAYPHVMTMLPDFANCEYIRVKPGKYTQKKYSGEWGVLEVSGESFDDIYPPLVAYEEGKQRGIYGKFTRFRATIPEITIGVARGALRIDAIHDGFIMKGDNSSSGLKKFIEEMYKIKSSAEKNGPLYLMAKLLMNSLYGKFIEKRHKFSTVPNIDERGNHLSVPNIQDKEVIKEVKNMWQLYGYEAVEAYMSNWCTEKKVRAEQISLNDYLSEDSYESGRYFNAPIASQITGFTRAKLMCAGAYLKAYQGDTDSLFVDFEKVSPENWKDFIVYMNEKGAITPEEGLGSFEIETIDKNKQSIPCNGLFVKKKVYFLEYQGKIKKMGHHGFSGIDGKKEMSVNEVTRALVEQYCKDGDITEEDKKIEIATEITTKNMIEEYWKNKELKYETKKRPMRLKQALRFSDTIGKFAEKKISLTLVDNPYQERDVDGWLHWKKSAE